MACHSTLWASLAIRGWFPVWLAVLLGILAIAGVAFAYSREAGRIPASRRALLATLRGFALVTILLLILRPTWVLDGGGDRPRPIVILVDDSQSMKFPDPRQNYPDRFRAALAYDLIAPNAAMPAQPNANDIPADTPARPLRIDIAKAILKNPRLKLLKQLEDVGPIRPMVFGLRRMGKDPNDPLWADSLKGEEGKTALADAVVSLLRAEESDLPAAIVIITDGRENASNASLDDAAREAARIGVPLHVIGVGSSTVGTLRISGVDAPDAMYVDDTLAIPVRFRVQGLKDARAEISVTLSGKEIATKTVEMKDTEDYRETLTFVPTARDVQPGKQDMITTIRVTSGGETITDTVSKSVRVVDRKVKVLVLDSTPRWDFKFLQRALLRDRRVEANFHLTDADARAMRAGPPFISEFPTTRAELFGYDLLVLGDIAANTLTREQQQFIKDFVSEGGGLVHVAGRNLGPASFVGTPLADVLPVEFQSEKFPPDATVAGYRPEPTPAGLRSPLLSLAEDPLENNTLWRSLPEMYWHYPVTKLKPAAEAFLVHPKLKLADGSAMPLLATHYYGKGYCIFVAFDETWRWRFNTAETIFGRFWSQAVYLAGVPRSLGTKMTQLAMDTPDPLKGATGRVYARLFGPDLRPLTADRIEARIERMEEPGVTPQVTTVELRSVPNQPGEYVASVPFNNVGRYAFKVETGVDPAQLEYRVSLPATDENAPGSMKEDDLRTLAETSGGGFYREEDLSKLPGQVKPQRAPYARKDEILLWNKWMMALIIGLFSLEWFLRKYHSLS